MKLDHLAKRADEAGGEAHPIRSAGAIADKLQTSVEHRRIDQISDILQLDAARRAGLSRCDKQECRESYR